MKTCSYCGQQYPGDTEVCPVDQQPLKGLAESSAAVASSKVTCPQCGTSDDFTPAIEFRSSFSLPVFLFGGLIGVMFRNAGRPRRVSCNKCDTRFYISTPLSKASRVIFWLLVTPSIIGVTIALISIIRNLFSH
jgi:uncharacterized Zn-finger protein